MSCEIGAAEIETLSWEKQNGLLPAIVQDAGTLRVLMLGYMTTEAVARTLETGHVTFHSRARGRLWTKGESSGNRLELVSIRTDCDRDSLLVLARPTGPTCHLERDSCFEDAPGEFLAELDTVLMERERERPAGSYTGGLFAAGTGRIAQKVGEEGVETALAGVLEDDDDLLDEAADLVFHLGVLMHARGMRLGDVVQRLSERRA